MPSQDDGLPSSNVMGTRERMAEADAALGRGDGAAAREIFESLPETAATLAGIAQALYLEHEYGRSIETWERAYAAHRAAGERIGAVRAARALAFLNGTVFGNAALMNGWLGRAKRLVGSEDSVEAGWVAIARGQFEDDRARRTTHFKKLV